MQQFFVKTEAGVTRANYPIRENGIDSKPFEVSDEDLKKVEEGTHDFDIVKDKLVLVESNRKQQAEAIELQKQTEIEAAKARKIELIQKVTEGKATKEEQEEFANLL
jgi:hypothetical protein